MVAAPMENVTQPTGAAVSGLSYHRLPNPLLPYLQGLPVVNGLDVDEVLRFLSTALQMRDFPGVRDTDLVMILAGYCRSPLAERLRGVWSKGSAFEEFHKAVLEFCIPARMFEHLKMKLFYRPQAAGEDLANFVAGIKESRRVLRLPHGEEETIQILLEGLAPEERSRLALSQIPRNFSELDRWCLLSQNIGFLDKQRQEQGRPRPGPPVPSPVMQVSADSPPEEAPRRVLVCFGCNQPGHIRRFCPARGRQPFVPAPAVPRDPKNF